MISDLKSNNKFFALFNVFIFLSLFVFFITLFAAAFKGLPMCDESMSLLLYQNPQQNLFSSTFYIVVTKLFGWLPAEPQVYRLLALMSALLSSLIFAVGFWRWINAVLSHKTNLNPYIPFLVAFLIIGNIVQFFLFTGGLNYNTLNNDLILCSTGCFLWFLAQNNNIKTKFLLIYICGFLIGINFFIKFPSSVLFLAFLSIILPEKRKYLF
ncbi:MAG: hypothetical protein MZV64_27250 [Ignavibacteriales bacterium]|nr:hypothetical protein [Ignavibacteriales bacterium]